MNARATISWSSEVSFDESSFVDMVVAIKTSASQVYRGKLKNPVSVMNYLGHLMRSASNGMRSAEDSLICAEPGKRIYETPLTAEGYNLQNAMRVAERIQTRHFIITRNETVNDEEYCTFYGSSGNLWRPELCDYQRGDYVERIRQTVHDMECDPRIYRWTNVPSLRRLETRMQTDGDFKLFAEEKLMPLLKCYWKQTRFDTDVEVIRKKLTEIADVADRYKKEKGLARLE